MVSLPLSPGRRLGPRDPYLGVGGGGGAGTASGCQRDYKLLCLGGTLRVCGTIQELVALAPRW